MKIAIKESGGKGFTIPLPNAMIFSPTLIRFGLKIGRHYTDAAIPDIPPEALHALSKAVKELHRKYGTWELVHVESAQGDTVIISI